MGNQFNFMLALPEIILAVVAMLILLLEVFSKSKNSVLSYCASNVAYVLVAAIILFQWNAQHFGTTFYGMFVVDPLANLMKIFCALAMLVAQVYGRQYVIERDMAKNGDIYSLSLFCFLGQMVLISAASMLTLFLGLELMSLALYALIALRRDSLQSAESAMKYFILGSLASGIMLYGISLIYGATGHIDINGIITTMADGQYNKAVLMLGTVFVLCGVGFKLGAVPFHMWIPDVYQGAPTAISLIVSTAPKIAALGMTFRLVVDGLHTVADSWQQMLMIMAVLSLAIGNLTAIMQTNFKRMLGYSTISHVGFVLLGLLAGVTKTGEMQTGAYGAALFYILQYVLTTLPAFGIILVLARQGFECEEIADLKGLNRRSPLLAFSVLLLMFSYAGIPPLVGFYAKVAVLQATIHAGYLWLAIAAVIFSLIGAFYYIRVVKVMYFDEPAEDAPAVGSLLNFRGGVMSINSLVILLLGILPGGLMALCTLVVNSSFQF
ncbi:NADH-quinone oxidoreductase subunit NuoN [Brackiella oedipodis]|uniref:NADH-quinone oxidoreductase subunit NuoN n=1 Tax=Brackiella oedipodis TaxID=124225 RepID=UPI00057080A5|nr:NADH-quinone oxidoreductase subunit NuoN [Brackiella oedipodis]